MGGVGGKVGLGAVATMEEMSEAGGGAVAEDGDSGEVGDDVKGAKGIEMRVRDWRNSDEQ